MTGSRIIVAEQPYLPLRTVDPAARTSALEQRTVPCPAWNSRPPTRSRLANASTKGDPLQPPTVPSVSYKQEGTTDTVTEVDNQPLRALNSDVSLVSRTAGGVVSLGASSAR